MLKKIILAAALSAVFLMPANAANCNGDLALIDAAMATAKVSPADKAAAMALRKEGADRLKAGDQNGGCAALKEAKMKLGIK